MTGAVLSAVSRIVRDYDEAIRFFCDALGFRRVEDIDQGRKRRGTVAPPGGGGVIVMARADTPAQRAAIGNQGAGRIWLFLRTDDFDRDRARMQAAAIVFEAPPNTSPMARLRSGATFSAIAGI